MKDSSKPTKKITQTLTSPVMFLTVGFLSSSLVVVAPAVVLQHGHHGSSEQECGNNKSQQRNPPLLLHKDIYAYGVCNTLWTNYLSSPIWPMMYNTDYLTKPPIHPVNSHSPPVKPVTQPANHSTKLIHPTI